jgi:hypothetical protein
MCCFCNEHFLFPNLAVVFTQLCMPVSRAETVAHVLLLIFTEVIFPNNLSTFSLFFPSLTCLVPVYILKWQFIFLNGCGIVPIVFGGSSQEQWWLYLPFLIRFSLDLVQNFRHYYVYYCLNCIRMYNCTLN